MEQVRCLSRQTCGYLTFCVALLCIALCGYEALPTIRTITCTDDMPTRYAGELHEMLGDCEIGPMEKRHIEGEVCACGYYHDTVDYYSWPVTYRDSLGQAMTVELNNHEDLYAQQLNWLAAQMSAHFFPLASRYCERIEEHGSYCFCSVGDIAIGWNSAHPEQKTHIDTGYAYQKKLIDDKQAMPLYALRYDQVFDQFPMRLSIQIKLTDLGLDADGWNARFEAQARRVEQGVNDILTDTGGNVNMDICLYSEHTDPDIRFRDRRWYFLRGESLSGEDAHDFSHAVFESYNGIFW